MVSSVRSISHRQQVPEVFVVDLHDLNQDFQLRALFLQQIGLTVEPLCYPLRDVGDCMGLSAPSGPVCENANRLTLQSSLQFILNLTEDLVVTGICIENLIKAKGAGFQTTNW